MSTKQEYLINKLDNIVQSINFDELIKCFDMFSIRFRRIFSSYNSPLANKVTNENAKKIFVMSCLNTNEKEFIGLLLHSGQYIAAHIIEPTTIDITDVTLLDPRKGRITSTCPYLNLNTNKDRLMQKTYSFRNDLKITKSPRGLCLIINNYLTFGTFKETQRFRNIFYQLHFDVIMEQNLTAKQIMQKLNDLSRDPMLENHEAFACLIISHGTEKGEIIGFDGDRLDMKDMCHIFDDQNCTNLRNKQRIFIFNCGQGNQDIDYEDPTISYSFYQSQVILPKVPKMINFLVCFTTLDGYYSYNNWDKETKFGSILCYFLVNKGWDSDINNILISVNNILHTIQPFEWTQSLTNALNFNPEYPFIIELPS